MSEGIILAILSILGASLAASFKFYNESKLAQQKLELELIKESLESDDQEERTKALKFLTKTNIIKDKEIKRGLEEWNDHPPQYQKKPMKLNNIHEIIGTWEYIWDEETYFRKFTHDRCILFTASGVIWKYPYDVLSNTKVVVWGSNNLSLIHELQSDGKLKIENGRYTAMRVMSTEKNVHNPGN